MGVNLHLQHWPQFTGNRVFVIRSHFPLGWQSQWVTSIRSYNIYIQNNFCLFRDKEEQSGGTVD